MSEEKSIWIVPVEESKGILDPSVAYTFECIELEMEKDVITHKNAPFGEDGVKLKPLDSPEVKEYIKREGELPEDWIKSLQNKLRSTWKVIDEHLEVVIYENWRVDKLTINENDPRFETRAVTFAKRTGHVVEVGKSLDLHDIVWIGMQLEAQPEEKRDLNNKLTGKHRFDLNTLKAIKDSVRIQKVFDDVSSELKAKVLGYVSECTSKEDAMGRLVKMKKTNLMGAYLALIESGEISY